jgi:nitrogen fixation-related uncharacterized protein
MEGAANRILFDEDDVPLPKRKSKRV